MKRQLQSEGASQTQDSSRRAKARRRVDSRGREDDELATGELDLNATPRGFDLNAPVAEEEGSQEHGAWQDKSLVCMELPAETGQTELEDPVHLEAAEQLSSPKLYQTGQDDEDTEKIIATTVIEADRVEVNEEHYADAGSAPSSRPPVSISIPLETPSGLGIDEDLDIIRSAWAALLEGNMLALDTVLADACEELSKSSQNLSKYHLLSCLYISKRFPEAFRLPKTYQILLSFLGCGKGQPAPKRQNLLPSLACKLLNRAFASETEWPMDFVEHYLEDAIGVRAWIETDGCKEFVSNVLSAFPDPVADSNGGLDEIRQDLQGPADLGHGLASQGPVRNRYPGDEARRQVRTEFLNALYQLLATNATKENPRVLLRLLAQGAGYEEVRVLGSSMLEGWLNNPVHVRSAKSLLDCIVKHTHATSENDFNTVANLLALRVTSLQVPGQMKSLHGNIFTDMVSQLVRRRPEYATLALKTFVTAEINNRNPHNVKSIATVLKAMTDCLPPEQELALILQELAANEDSRPHLKDLVRRIMKQAGPDINVHALCHGLMQPWPAMEEQHEPVKEAWLKQIVDLVCQLLLHAVAQYATDEGLVTAILSSPPALGSRTYPSGCAVLKEKLSVMEKFSIETANLQEDAMAWCTDVLAVYLPRIQETKFLHTVRQLLFLEGPEAYSINSEHCGDLDMLCYKLLTSCLRAPEEILARLILMGISSYPLSQTDAIDIIEGLVWRAVKLQNHMDGVLTAKSDQLPAAIFKLASANLSANIRLQFMLKDLYWRAAIVVLTIAVCNPMTIGQSVWLNCPSIRFIMEFILTGRTPLYGEGADKFEADKLELDALQRDIKAEEAISAFYAAQAASEVVTLVPWPFQGEEWRGNVMVLNQGGPPRQPPVSVLEELKHIDEAYQLGSMLRKCKNPNFFSEVTSSQTLQQAWTWLEKIIISDPDVMTVLPCLWQCELLYMYEISAVTSERQILDLLGVRSNLHKIITQGTQIRDVDDVNIVIGFLASKLASRNSRSRYCARRCFTRLVTGDLSPAVADFAGSASEKGGSAGGPFDPDNCEWLEMVAGGATKFQVIEVLAPALQLAIQMESSVHVVSAYLEFLQKHLACLQSPGCLTCCVSCLVVQRRSLCACLFSEFSNGSGSMEIRYPSVSNFVLQTVLGALQLGSAFNNGWSKFVVSEAPIVTLVSPKSAASTVVRVEVHKMVVDAAIQLVAWFANRSLKVAKQTVYEQLLEFLLPGFVHCSTQTSHDDPVMAWLEAPGGQRFPLLSQVQATSFARSKDPRVFTAGFSVLSIEARLDLLAGLGLSTLAGSALLEEFDEVSETRLKVALSSKGITNQRVKKIENSVILLQKSGSKGGAIFLAMLRSSSSDLLSYSTSLVRAQSHEKQDDVLCSSNISANTKVMKDMRELEVLSPLEELHGNCSSNQPLIRHASELFSGPDMATKRSDPSDHQKRQTPFMCSKYVQFRKIFAKCVLEANYEDFNKCLEFMMESLTRNKSAGATATSSSALSLPILWFLWHCRRASTRTPNGCEIEVEQSDILEFRATSLAILSLLQSWLHQAPGDGNIPTGMAGLCLARATSIVEVLGDMSSKDCPGEGQRFIYSKVRAQLSVGNYSPSFSLLEDGPVQKFEAELLAILSLTYARAISGKTDQLGKSTSSDTVQSASSFVIREFVNLLRNWQDGSSDCELHNSEDYIPAQRKQVELSGRIGLIVEVLLFLDPELRSHHHLQAVLGVQASSFSTGRELEAPSHAKLGLECILHRASWKAVCQVIAGIFSTQENHPVSLEQDVTEKGNGKMLADSGVSMEFVASCMQHRHARLACRISNESNLKDVRFKLVTSFFQPASVHVLVRLGVLECSVVRLSMNTTVQNVRGGLGHNLGLLSRHNRVLKLIMIVASEGPELMSNVVQQLLHLQKGNGQEILATLKSIPTGRDTMRESIKLAASDILLALYAAFPVSVMQVCGHVDEKEFMAAIPRSLISSAEQVSCLSQVLHKTLALIFGGSEKDSNAAYEFLHAFGRQHPSLVVPHLPMVALHLQNLLPAVKQGDNQLRSAVARTLSMVIELLDALRPYVLEQNNMTWESADKGGCNQADGLWKCHVEIILAMYLDFLQDLDRPQFAKVVPRVADFLCHCVAMGGRCRQFVMSYHKPVLQTAAQTFGKIKKLGYLLTLLENASFSGIAEESTMQDHPAKSASTGAVTGPSSLPIDDVLKVRKQLLQYLRWQTPDKWEDADFSGSGKERCYSPRHVHGLYMEEVEDLNLGAALTDLEMASARMPTLLPLLEDSLLELSKVSDSNIRDKAYSLLQRQLLHCPSKQTANKIVKGLLEQLTSSDVSLAKSAARHVSPFFHCCPEFQEAVLVEMLKLGRPAADDLQQLVQGLFAIAGET